MKLIVTACLVLGILGLTCAISNQTNRLIGLENVACLSGENVTLTCIQNLTSNSTVAVSWYFVRTVLEDSSIRFPLQRRHSEYRMTNLTNGQSLSIDSIALHDAGIYSCQSLLRDIGTTTEIRAHLIVIASNPVCEIDKTTANETEDIGVRCNVTYSGNWDPTIQCRGIGSKVVQGIDNKTIRRNITKSNNVTTLSIFAQIPAELRNQLMHLECDTVFNSMNLKADFVTNIPTYKHTWTSSEIQVGPLYGARNVTVSPIKDVMFVGESLNCYAVGNPKPEFDWINVETEKITPGTQLLISQSMIRKENHTFRCMAKNFLSEDFVEIAFSVKIVAGQKSIDRPFIIVTAITGVVCIILLIVLGFVISRKYFIETKDKSSNAVQVARQDNDLNEYDANDSLELGRDDGAGEYVELPLTGNGNAFTVQQPPANSSTQKNCSTNSEPKTFMIVGADGTEYAQVNPRTEVQGHSVPAISQPSMFSKSNYAYIDHTSKPLIAPKH